MAGLELQFLYLQHNFIDDRNISKYFVVPGPFNSTTKGHLVPYSSGTPTKNTLIVAKRLKINIIAITITN